MKKIAMAFLLIVFQQISVAETFNVYIHGNHQVLVGVDDFDGSMVRTILTIRDKKLNSSEADQYIKEIGYVCSPSYPDKNSLNIRAFYTTSHYVFGSKIGGSLGSTRSYHPLQVKFDESDKIINVPLVNKPGNNHWPELDLADPALVDQMKSSNLLRVRDGYGRSAVFNMTGVASAFNEFYRFCK